jgi:hypothetical protein
MLYLNLEVRVLKYLVNVLDLKLDLRSLKSLVVDMLDLNLELRALKALVHLLDLKLDLRSLKSLVVCMLDLNVEIHAVKSLGMVMLDFIVEVSALKCFIMGLQAGRCKACLRGHSETLATQWVCPGSLWLYPQDW